MKEGKPMKSMLTGLYSLSRMFGRGSVISLVSCTLGFYGNFVCRKGAVLNILMTKLTTVVSTVSEAVTVTMYFPRS
jgi:hypothetical protein